VVAVRLTAFLAHIWVRNASIIPHCLFRSSRWADFFAIPYLYGHVWTWAVGLNQPAEDALRTEPPPNRTEMRQDRKNIGSLPEMLLHLGVFVVCGAVPPDRVQETSCIDSMFP
jgi:hypothetical protein